MAEDNDDESPAMDSGGESLKVGATGDNGEGWCKEETELGWAGRQQRIRRQLEGGTRVGADPAVGLEEPLPQLLDLWSLS